MAIADRDAIMEHPDEDNWNSARELDEKFETQAARTSKPPTLYKPGRNSAHRLCRDRIF